MRFSQRIGITPVRTAIQGRNLDLETRTRLWNVFATVIPSTGGRALHGTWMKNLYGHIWAEHFKKAIDELPIQDYPIREQLKALHRGAKWNEVYDFVELVMQSDRNGSRDTYQSEIAKVLEEELAGFRVMNGQLVEITDESELVALEAAFTSTATERFGPARQHLTVALQRLSDRRAPDYRNSIKESISSVEAVVQILSGDSKAEFAIAVRLLEKKAPVHGALKRALLALYGYTSDAEGIRHALSEEPNLDAADAKFMLVACAAFVVFLIQKIGPIAP